MIAWHDLLAAVALVLVLEGMMPFLRPTRWRTMISMVLKQPDNVVRMMGLTSMLFGLGLLYMVR